MLQKPLSLKKLPQGATRRLEVDDTEEKGKEFHWAMPLLTPSNQIMHALFFLFHTLCFKTPALE